MLCDILRDIVAIGAMAVRYRAEPIALAPSILNLIFSRYCLTVACNLGNKDGVLVDLRGTCTAYIACD